MTARTYESLPTAAARIGVSVKTLRRRIADGAPPRAPVRPDPHALPGRRRRPVPSLRATDLTASGVHRKRLTRRQLSRCGDKQDALHSN